MTGRVWGAGYGLSDGAGLSPPLRTGCRTARACRRGPVGAGYDGRVSGAGYGLSDGAVTAGTPSTS
jgi:hypothetical protein